MENLIRETLDHGDRVTPILGVGLAPLDVSDEDREVAKRIAVMFMIYAPLQTEAQ